MHNAAMGEFQHFGPVEDRPLEHKAVLERAAKQVCVVDRPRRVAKRHGAGFHQRPHFRQFLPVAVFADAAHDVDVDVAGSRRLLPHKLHASLRIDRRLGIRQATDRSEATSERGGRSRFDRLVFLAAWLAQLHMGVDQARRDDAIRGVDDLAIARGLQIEASDPSSATPYRAKITGISITVSEALIETRLTLEQPR